MTEPKHRVVLLPGGVLPAEFAYPPLLSALGNEVDGRAKELEIYATDEPPADYTLQSEVDGIARFADQAGFDRFHLVGYSGGGASCLAFCAAHPERLLSLALNEPAWAGRRTLADDEAEVWRRFGELASLPPPEMMEAFIAVQLAPGVDPPPPSQGEPPPWMAKRPAGLKRFIDVFLSTDLDMDRLRAFTRPVLFTLGGKSNPAYYRREAERLGRIFSDFTLEVFPDRHHFDPPHRVEPDRMARSLLALFERANQK